MLAKFYVLCKRVLRYHFNCEYQSTQNTSPVGLVLWDATCLRFICLGSLSAHIIKYSLAGSNADLMMSMVYEVVMFIFHY